MFQLCVKTIQGDVRVIEQPTLSVAELKANLSRDFPSKPPIPNQVVIQQGKILQDSDQVSTAADVVLMVKTGPLGGVPLNSNLGKQITVQHLWMGGDQTTMLDDFTDTVGSVLRRLSNETGILPELLFLLSNGGQRMDDPKKTLGDYDVFPGSTIKLFMRRPTDG